MAERERDPYLLELKETRLQPGLQCSWGLGNQLFVYRGKKAILLTDEDRQQLDGSPAQIHDVRWDTDMHGPVTRRLVNESHNIFITLQQQMSDSSGASLRPLLIKASKQYRSILKACSLDQFNLASVTADETQKQFYEDQQRTFDLTELIWSLCEILWIDVAPGGVVIGQLLEWIRWHFTDGERLAAEILSTENPEQHREYWDCIYRLVLQGQVDKVLSLLSRSVAAHTEGFQSMRDLLRKMPVSHQLFRGNSVSEFEMKWRHWKDDCQRRMDEGEFATNRNLEMVARILCGDEVVFSELRDLCETWYHMLVSKMLYQRPTVKSVDLHFYAQKCLDEYRTDGRLGELDSILLSALEFDIHQVIKDCSAVLSSWWFPAHLTDILHHCGQLESHRLEYGNIREYLLLEYASTLMSHKSLWQVGVDYFDECGDLGRKYLEHYIEHMPIETQRKAEKILTICEKRNMSEHMKSICKVMGMRCIRNQRLGSALSWFLRSKDVAFATLVAEKFLSEYNENGSFSNLDLIDNLGSSMLLSSRLTFLGKYREYHKLYEGKDFFAAGSLLLSLLTSRLAPREFWITLLKDAIALLEAKELIFGSTETYELMHCLEELTKDRMYLNTDDADDLSDLKETIDLLNLALTRNLARSIVIEGTTVGK